MNKRKLIKFAIVAGIMAGCGLMVGRNPEWRKAIAENLGLHKAEISHSLIPPDAPRITADGKLLLTHRLRSYQRLRVVEVADAPPTDVLRLPGSVGLDPNRLLRIHSRFSGEIIRIGTVLESDGARERPLRFGDFVKKGQVMAVVWSREIGEKKSELVDAISKMRIDKNLLDRLYKVEEGVVAERERLDAKRNYESDLINVARAERTLRSWKLSEEEIDAVYQEADELTAHSRTEKARLTPSHTTNDSRWAELEIRAPIDAVILEKNFNEGSFIDTDDDLFKIADTSVLQVLANVWEEQLPLLTALPVSQRIWKIEVKSDPNGVPRIEPFSQVGRIIDPQQHTAKVVGWLDNHENRLTVGQFITATIEIPAEVGLVVIPTQAIQEEGDQASVLVQTPDNEDEFSLRRVSVVRRERDRAHVRSHPSDDGQIVGLNVGEKVVASGVLTLVAELRLNKTGPKTVMPSADRRNSSDPSVERTSSQSVHK